MSSLANVKSDFSKAKKRFRNKLKQKGLDFFKNTTEQIKSMEVEINAAEDLIKGFMNIEELKDPP